MEDKLECLRKVALVVGDSIRNLKDALTAIAEAFECEWWVDEVVISFSKIKKIRDRKTVKAKPHRYDAKPKKGYTTINKWNRIRSNPRLR